MSEEKIRPQDRWDAKNGIISKTFKVNKNVAEDFQATCKRLGVGMGPQLTKLMQQFIEQNK